MNEELKFLDRVLPFCDRSEEGSMHLQTDVIMLRVARNIYGTLAQNVQMYGIHRYPIIKFVGFSAKAALELELDGAAAKTMVKNAKEKEKDRVSFRREDFLAKIRTLLEAASGKEEIEQALNWRICSRIVWDYKLHLQLQDALEHKPELALQVLDWRRRQKPRVHLQQRDYTRGISLAGKTNNIYLAAEMFEEAIAGGLHNNTGVYNAMVSSYEKNGLLDKAWAVYEDMKKNGDCKPTPVTFNILQVLAKKLGSDKTQLVERALMDSGLPLTVQNFDGLVANYGDARMWDRVEETLQKMKASGLQPQLSTYKVLAQVYAQADELEKMEEVRTEVQRRNLSFDKVTRTAMVQAYSRSRIADQIVHVRNILEESSSDMEKIVTYAQGNYVEEMEACLEKAFENKTRFHDAVVVQEVAALYLRHEALDKLETFLQQAREIKWELSHHVYHRLLSTYGKAKRFDDMERTFQFMKSSGCSGCLPRRRTFLIMHRAYQDVGKETELKLNLERMKIAGVRLPRDFQSSLQETLTSSSKIQSVDAVS